MPADDAPDPPSPTDDRRQAARRDAATRVGLVARRNAAQDSPRTLTMAPGALDSWQSTAPDARASADTAASGAAAADGSAPSIALTTTRYAVLERLGVGGQGEVFRVFDREMRRPLAMKVLRRSASADARARFVTESTLTAGLEHPGIVPIYARGSTVDGRPWYTMQILDGVEFAAVLADRAQPLRRRVDVFVRACEAVAYAHQMGVIHRDLKPQNIMIGAFGEVRVLDWGLARRLWDRPDEGGAATSAATPTETPVETRAGMVMGTPRYMAPEQLTADRDRLGPPTDVYALGLILAELLTGEPPAGRTIAEIGVSRRADLPPPPVGPEPLRRLCAAATRLDPAARLPDASALAEAVRTWLEGAEKRAQAEALVAEAQAIEPRIAALRAEAAALDARAAQILDPLPPHAPIAQKSPGWALDDAATAKRRAARLAEIELRQTLQSALRLDPDSAAAGDALTAHYRSRLLQAEASHDADRAAEFEALLRGHDPAGNVEWLRGQGRVTLFTDPAGAAVEIWRFEERDRRLVEVPTGRVEATPFVDLPLAMGSYLLKIRHPGRCTVRYLVNIARNGAWEGVPPGAERPFPIPLPEAGAIGEGECYVPAGWVTLGGDPDAMDGLPAHRLWVDGFVIARDPVTHGQYIEWLDGLVADGQADGALSHVPRYLATGRVREPAYIFEAGRFRPTEAFGYLPETTWPVVGVSWHSATAFAAWRASRSGSGYMLPGSWQWEKAARGVDGRFFPWGDTFEVNWANTLNHTAGSPSPMAVDAVHADIGPYGLRGATGNTRDLCRDVYRRAGPDAVDGRPRSDAPGTRDFVVVKGGCFVSKPVNVRLAGRFGQPADESLPMVGFRLCRPIT